jgi:hypothetical protein
MIGRELALLRWRKQLEYPIEFWPVPARLAHPQQRDNFFEAILSEGNVTAACDKLGMARGSVYNFAAKDKEFRNQFDVVCDYLYHCLRDDAIKIADDARREGSVDANGKSDPFKASFVRTQVDARLRVAGLHKPSVEVNVDARTQTLVVNDEQRAKLIEMREQALAKKDESK